ncbi:alpha-amylase family protein [Glaciecola sp. MH2013]|uniref:alpha-amylase family protein n=1 Tax=Glaciecola sp. MH2013 TaxID=2785524 RepID=UPI00189F3938|nr:alpha-amylase family protein [Glaciecola sp. MH2013]MBF7072690.1 alpha-amylase family protein [Glaciecola sp. MH2013]
MSSIFKRSVLLGTLSVIISCSPNQQDEREDAYSLRDAQGGYVHPHFSQGDGKPVVYQVFTRLYGNKNTTNKAWGSIDENGVGKFSDFDNKALQDIKALGTSYIWYTGVPHHAVINDYTDYGISLDDPDVVKGRAGSPYAVKDYYNVNPDLADQPENRLQEFEALIKRTHENGMKVIIDIVPNHVARGYESLTRPDDVSDFGENDDTSLEYARDNNFYYVVGESFKVPEGENGYRPLGGETHPLADGKFNENPAKWTGNGARAPQPGFHDWYETVKVNYGVRPDGSYDFDELPADYANKDLSEHRAFWKNKDVPDSWVKFEQIVHYWLDKGVDGFRYDMAEMVPVEFWSYLNSSIKEKKPEAFLLAEVYNPSLYRDYLALGKMDYLYDKVEFYDSLKLLMQGKGPAQPLEDIQASLADIELNMLHFLENHDEQRIASPEFAGNAEKGKPALVVSALISRSPTMLYFGQDVGEDGSEEPGFGDPSRTSIFDYMGVPAHQRWMNNGAFDGGQSSVQEVALRAYYEKVMNISATHPTMLGKYASLHSFNVKIAENDVNNAYAESMFSFVRYTDSSALIVVSSFKNEKINGLKISLPVALLSEWKLVEGSYAAVGMLNGFEYQLDVGRKRSAASITLGLPAFGSAVLEINLAPTKP